MEPRLVQPTEPLIEGQVSGVLQQRVVLSNEATSSLQVARARGRGTTVVAGVDIRKVALALKKSIFL